MKSRDEHIPNKRLHSAFLSKLSHHMIFLSYLSNVVDYIISYCVYCMRETNPTWINSFYTK